MLMIRNPFEFKINLYKKFSGIQFNNLIILKFSALKLHQILINELIIYFSALRNYHFKTIKNTNDKAGKIELNKNTRSCLMVDLPFFYE